MGAATLGNLYQSMTDDNAQKTIAAALAAGVNYVDTAPFYGRGLSERRVGKAARGRPDIVLSTKVGRLLLPDRTIADDREHDGFYSSMPFRAAFDYTRDGVLRSWEASLHRLGLAKVDILYVHDIGRRTHGDNHDRIWRQLTFGGGLRALEELRDAGEIAGIGIGVNEVDVCLATMAEARLDAILLAGRYTLLEQAPLDELFPKCAATQTSIIVGGPYNSGILASGTRGIHPKYYDYAPASEDVIGRVRAMEEIADHYDVPLAAMALQFPLAHPQVASVIPGLSTAKQAHVAKEMLSLSIPAQLWSELKDINLIRSDAPTKMF
ncbi:MAG: aldo/keto reductase [Rhizorhabdus sp.]